MSIRVLVTGVNSTTAQSIIKALRASGLPVEIFGCDINPYSSGLYRVDRGFLVKPFTDPGYEAQMLEILQRYRIDALLSGIDAELLSLAERKSAWEAKTGCRILVNQPSLLKITLDKYETARFLKAHGCSAPASALETELRPLIDQVGFPLVIKPRRGASSRHVYVVHSEAELFERLRQVPHPVVQEYLGSPEEEYTCGAFVDANGTLKGIATLQRTLMAGSTHTAIVGHFPDVEQEVRRVIAALRPMGSCNVQLRRNRQGRPTTFEINARFSSSVSIRAHFGFNEVEAALRSLVLGQEVPEMRCRPGVAMRYANEVYAEQTMVQALLDSGEHQPASVVEQHF